MDGKRSALGKVTEVVGRTIEFSIPYNTRDTYGTMWLPGCFSASLQRKLPALVWGHDPRRIIGKVTGWRDTPYELQVTAELADPDDVPDAKMALALLRQGAVSDVSFGFHDGQGSPTASRDAVAMRSAGVHEFSLVLRGSVPNARVLSLRSADSSGWAAFAEQWLEDAELDEEADRAIAVLDCRLIEAGGADVVGRRSIATLRRRPSARPLEPMPLVDPTPREFYEGTVTPPVIPPSAAPFPLPPAGFVGEDELRRVFGVGETFTAQPVPDGPCPPEIFANKPEGWTDQQAYEAWQRRTR